MDQNIAVYTEENHFKDAIPEILNLHERIMKLEGMKCEPVKKYIGTKIPEESSCWYKNSEEAIKIGHVQWSAK